jgi:hypothetical protein
MPQTIFYKLPKKYHVGKVTLQKLPNIEDLDSFIKLANKFRNIFRNHFLNQAYVPYEESYEFFCNLNYDSSRVLYAISLHGTWIGHFGARYFKDKNIVLDNALRFSPIGGKDLFKKINLSLINLIRKSLPEHNILIIVDRKNTSALKLHGELNFRECPEKMYEKMSIDSSSYIMKILVHHD